MVQALSIRQPWAELIVSGRKTLELRSWTTRYRGRLWIHTGASSDGALERALGFEDLFKGGYVGAATLDGIFPLDIDRWRRWRNKHLDPGGYQSGYYAWVLAEPVRFVQPVTAAGQPGLYAPAPALCEQLIAEEARSASASIG